jgi:hypothetical protein
MDAEIDYDGRAFRSLQNSETGEVSAATTFSYHQQDDIVWAEYSGGEIVRGMLLANVDEKGALDVRYQHVNSNGHLMTGTCRSVLQVLPDGGYRLHESWHWANGDCSAGQSVVEEIVRDSL